MQRRTYGDPCGVARALDAVGERWALLVVRELLLGPKRFSALHRGLGAASQNVLAQRLRELEAAGIVRRRPLGPPAGAWVYELTQPGAELEPGHVALGHWGRNRPMTAEAELSVDALVLALKTTFDPVAAGDLEASLDLHVDDDQLELAVTGGRLAITRASAKDPDATLRTDAPTLRELAFRKRRLDDAVAAGDGAEGGGGAARGRGVDGWVGPDSAGGRTTSASWMGGRPVYQ